MTRPGGTAVIIHRADCLEPLLAALNGRFGGVVVLPLHPRAGEPASRVIVRAVKASRAPLRIAQGLVLHDDNGTFQPGIKAVLSAPRALDWPRLGRASG
jgi:tRNA1(Val) A37 N6-methylase TrmN6